MPSASAAITCNRLMYTAFTSGTAQPPSEFALARALLPLRLCCWFGGQLIACLNQQAYQQRTAQLLWRSARSPAASIARIFLVAFLPVFGRNAPAPGLPSVLRRVDKYSSLLRACRAYGACSASMTRLSFFITSSSGARTACCMQRLNASCQPSMQYQLRQASRLQPA